MRSRFFKIFPLLIVCGWCGCQSNQTRVAAPGAPALSAKKSFDLPARNNSLALLDDLLNDEKDVSKILFIKSAPPELKQLVKAISKTADAGAKFLKAEEKKDGGLRLSETGLPPGEKAARAGIAKIKEHTLLHSSGAEFELQLLLTQNEALTYGAQLAQTAADNDPQRDRARELLGLSAQLQQLGENVVALLRKK